MRRLVLARAVAAAMGLVLPAAADQQRCPLDLSTCLMEFAKMRERPWVGVLLDQDTTTGVITVTQVLPDRSAAKTPTRAPPTACGETRTAAAPPVAIPSHRARRTCYAVGAGHRGSIVPNSNHTPRGDTMEVIRGTTRPRRRRRWWTARPGLRLVRDQQTLQTREDPLFIAMIGSFALFLMAFAMFMGGWTGG